MFWVQHSDCIIVRVLYRLRKVLLERLSLSLTLLPFQTPILGVFYHSKKWCGICLPISPPLLKNDIQSLTPFPDPFPSAQDPEFPPILMASLDLWCLSITRATQTTAQKFLLMLQELAWPAVLQLALPDVWDHRWQKSYYAQKSPSKPSQLKPPSHVIWWQMYFLSHNHCKLVMKITQEDT